jgi:hypothetical protein
MAVAFTQPPTTELPELEPLWHPTAPRSLRKGTAVGGCIASWPAWQKHLACRKRPAAPTFLQGKNPALLWGWPDPQALDAVHAFLALPSDENFSRWLSSIDGPMDLPQAVQAVALAYTLPNLAAKLMPETWWRLAHALHELAVDSQQYRVDWPAQPQQVLRQQLLAGELPLALGYLFPEVRALRALRKAGRAALSEALVELTDGQGLPHARLLSVLGPLFACWTRARWLGARLARGSWSRKADYQYQWLVRYALRLTDDDGRFLLTPLEHTVAWNSDAFAMALELAGDSGDCAAAELILPRRAIPKRIEFQAGDAPDPSLNSDWSGIAVLANGWSSGDARLAINYADEPIHIELAVDGERVFIGKWTSSTTCDGEPVHTEGEWERLCWETAKRFDFLELGIQLSHGLRLERQVLFGRHDAVLYLADIIISSNPAPRQLKHSLQLPLDDHDSWQPERETRDGLIIGHRARAAVLPLALAEWRADPRGGELSDDAGRLTLTQQSHGRAICCPLLFDLDRKRSKKERTWRQLTVGDSLETVPRDVAVGFRAQSGRDQWLIYRSLGPAGNRTVLGQNIAGEFSAGPFLRNGKYKEWIEIEAV